MLFSKICGTSVPIPNNSVGVTAFPLILLKNNNSYSNWNSVVNLSFNDSYIMLY